MAQNASEPWQGGRIFNLNGLTHVNLLGRSIEGLKSASAQGKGKIMSWIISDALMKAYESSHCSLEQGAESSGVSCSDGELSAPSSSTLTRLGYCAPGKMTDLSRLSRFGMMFEPLTESRGKDVLTWFLAVSPAKTLAQQEKEQELQESEADYGLSSLASLAKYDPDTHSLRTRQCSLFEDLNTSLQTWPHWGLMQGGVCWEQPMSARPIFERGSGLLPTITATEGGRNKSLGANAKVRPTLTTMARKNLWPTPVTTDADKGGRGELIGMIRGTKGYWGRRYPAPVAWDWKSRGRKHQLSTTANGKLNPTWLEWLMGFPLGWTALNASEMHKYRNVQQKLSDY